jgi:hypothetical protein
MSGPELKELKLPSSVLVKQAIAILKEYGASLTILTIENVDDEGVLMVYLAGWDGKNFVVNPHKTLNPHEICRLNSQTMLETEAFSLLKGVYALVRTTSAKVWLKVTNLRDIDLNYLRMKGASFPPPPPPYIESDLIGSFKWKKDWVCEGEQVMLWYGGEVER